jgi:ATP-dependent DNA helicase RecQ
MTAGDPEVFAALKDLRRRLADDRGVPAYVVFSDATLVEMSEVLPRSSGEFLSINGVGPKKLETYGEQFLAVIEACTNEAAGAD